MDLLTYILTYKIIIIQIKTTKRRNQKQAASCIFVLLYKLLDKSTINAEYMNNTTQLLQ